MEPEDAYHLSGLYSHHQHPTANNPAVPGTGAPRNPSSGSTRSSSIRLAGALGRLRKGSPANAQPNAVTRSSSNVSNGAKNKPSSSPPTDSANESDGEAYVLSEPEGTVMDASTLTTTTVDSAAELVNKPTSANGAPSCLSAAPAADVNDCGLFSFRPRFLQPLANIKIFVFLLSLLVMVQQALASGYLNSVITTIEKRYEIPSYLVGVISSMYEIGNVFTVIFVSYLGSSRRIPVWIAVGCLVMGIGSMIFVIPQLASEQWSLDSPNQTQDDNICSAARVHDDTSDILNELGFGTFPGLSKNLVPNNGLQYTKRENCVEGSKSNVMPVFFFMLGQLLLGAGGSPLLTLGTTYIDDHVQKESSSMYIGIIYTMVAFGPVLGFLLGAYLLSYYVDTWFFPINLAPGVDHRTPRWIGMWWGGFLLCGALLLALSLPFFMFPKTLKKEKEKVRLEEKTKEFEKGHRRTKSQTSTCSKYSTLSSKRVYGKDVRDIPVSILKLLVNPIYVMTCLGACMELIIVSGFVVFLPKYLETQFSISNVQASVFTGGIAIPGACIGTFLGGYLLKRLSLRPKGAIQMVMAFNLMGLSLYGLLFVLGCDNVKMAGTTSPYFNSSYHKNVDFHNSMSGSGQNAFKVNLTAWCNLGCSCKSDLVEPVCGANGLTYFSACHAGCSSSSASNFLNCSCILGDFGYNSTPADSREFSEVTAVPVATAGPCYIPCNTIKPFMVLLFFMSTAVAISQMPLLMIVLRSVNEEERSFALGVQFVIFRLIAYIPAPIMFGSVIDSTCLLWKTSCDGQTGGRCLIYDIEKFRYRYVGICTAIKIISAAIFMLDWLLIRWKYKLDMEGTMTVGDIVNSLMSVNKGDPNELEDELEENVWLPELQGCGQPPNGPIFHQRSGSVISRPPHSGHRRSQSGTHVPLAKPRLHQHRRSHSSCGYQPITGPQPTCGILATKSGHERRASAGQQVTFRGLAEDPNDLTAGQAILQPSNLEEEFSPVDV